MKEDESGKEVWQNITEVPKSISYQSLPLLKDRGEESLHGTQLWWVAALSTGLSGLSPLQNQEVTKKKLQLWEKPCQDGIIGRKGWIQKPSHIWNKMCGNSERFPS